MPHHHTVKLSRLAHRSSALVPSSLMHWLPTIPYSLTLMHITEIRIGLFGPWQFIRVNILFHPMVHFPSLSISPCPMFHGRICNWHHHHCTVQIFATSSFIQTTVSTTQWELRIGICFVEVLDAVSLDNLGSMQTTLYEKFLSWQNCKSASSWSSVGASSGKLSP